MRRTSLRILKRFWQIRGSGMFLLVVSEYAGNLVTSEHAGNALQWRVRQRARMTNLQPRNRNGEGSDSRSLMNKTGYPPSWHMAAKVAHVHRLCTRKRKFQT